MSGKMFHTPHRMYFPPILAHALLRLLYGTLLYMLLAAYTSLRQMCRRPQTTESTKNSLEPSIYVGSRVYYILMLEWGYSNG